MSRKEIQKKFDEIVDFAEVEKFLDTPVKRYSSGMYVRLAFAVAAHLEPEILIVDEVLAVGDTQFQKKCLGKMDDVATEGRTVLFVSHNMAAINSLCKSILVLGYGELIGIGGLEQITKYLGQETARSSYNITMNARKKKPVLINQVWIEDTYKNRLASADLGGQLVFCIGYSSEFSTADFDFAITIHDKFGVALLHLDTYYAGRPTIKSDKNGVIRCSLGKIQLRGGIYKVDVFCHKNYEVIDHVVHAIDLEIIDTDYYHTGRMFPVDWGAFCVDQRWEV